MLVKYTDFFLNVAIYIYLNWTKHLHNMEKINLCLFVDSANKTKLTHELTLSFLSVLREIKNI